MTDGALNFRLDDASQVGEVRRAGAALSQRLGLSETLAGQLALAINEAGSNILQHARTGELLLSVVEQSGMVGVQLLALDRGPGMRDVGQCMVDGYSTAGTAGKGLGALSRLASVLDIYSAPGMGTALMLQLWPRALPPCAFDVGAVCVALKGEEVSGDGYWISHRPQASRFAVVDGLGHGVGASRAARAAEEVLTGAADLPLEEVLERAHAGLRPTRGAVLGMAEVSARSAQVRYVGVGNIAASVATPGGRQGFVSVNGTLGHEMRSVQGYDYTFPLERGRVLVMHSDGLQAHWKLEAYPGLVLRHPAVIAGVLYRDHGRGRDDVTVLVAARRAQGAA